MAAGSNLSKDFFDLVKAIGESKSKQEEDRIVVAEVAKLKKVVGDPSIKGKLLKEYLIRLIYVEMLGHDASFGYMKAVEVSRPQTLENPRMSCWRICDVSPVVPPCSCLLRPTSWRRGSPTGAPAFASPPTTSSA